MQSKVVKVQLNTNRFFFLVELDRLILKFILKCKGPRIVQNNFEDVQRTRSTGYQGPF